MTTTPQDRTALGALRACIDAARKWLDRKLADENTQEARREPLKACRVMAGVMWNALESAEQSRGATGGIVLGEDFPARYVTKTDAGLIQHLDPVARMTEAVGYAGAKTWDARSCVPPIIDAWPAVLAEIARLKAAAIKTDVRAQLRMANDEIARLRSPPDQPAGDGLRVAMEAVEIFAPEQSRADRLLREAITELQAAYYVLDHLPNLGDEPATGDELEALAMISDAGRTLLWAIDQKEREEPASCKGQQPQPPTMASGASVDTRDTSRGAGTAPGPTASIIGGSTSAPSSPERGHSSPPPASVSGTGSPTKPAPSSPPGESQTLGVPNGPTEIEAVKRWRELARGTFESVASYETRRDHTGDQLAFACEFERECNRLGMIALDKEKARADQACKDTLRAVAARLNAEHARDLAEKRLGEADMLLPNCESALIAALQVMRGEAHTRTVALLKDLSRAIRSSKDARRDADKGGAK